MPCGCSWRNLAVCAVQTDFCLTGCYQINKMICAHPAASFRKEEKKNIQCWYINKNNSASVNLCRWSPDWLTSSLCFLSERKQVPKIAQINSLMRFLKSHKPFFKQLICPCLNADNNVCYSGRFLLNFWLGTVSGSAFMPVQYDVWEVISHNKGLRDSHGTVSCHPGKWKGNMKGWWQSWRCAEQIKRTAPPLR